jgi:RNA polymerase sigma-70 factor (ECF subfamily)
MIAANLKTASQDAEWATLLHRIADRDEHALAELYRLSKPLIRAVIHRIVRDFATADEAVQDVYRYVWFHGQRFEAVRGSAVGWLLIIARSRAIDKVRGIQRNAKDCGLEECAEQTDRGTIDIGDLKRDRLVRNALQQIPRERRELIELAFIEGYSHEEIARKCAIPVGTVKTRIRTGLQAMKQILAVELGRTVEPTPTRRPAAKAGALPLLAA